MTALNSLEINNLVKPTYQNTVSRSALQVDFLPSLNKIKIQRKNHHFPTSWFITNEYGDINLSGKINSSELTINLNPLSTGNHQFRINGEVYDLIYN